VKMFTGGVEFRALKREIDVVRSLPHQENIVKLFGVEEEVSRFEILYMESHSECLIKKYWQCM